MVEQQYVVFRLGQEEYAVPISQVKEITEYKQATRLPNYSPYVEGIINLRGKLIPVINLAQKLGIESDIITDKRIMIIDTEKRDVGIVVDEVKEVIRLQDNSIESTKNNLTEGNINIKGIGKYNGRLLILIDLKSLVGGI